MELNNNTIEITKDVKDFLITNNHKSQHSKERYVYIKTLNNFIETRRDKTVFDNIRDWASDRGIYDKGNSHTQYVKLMEEAGELAQALLKNNKAETIDAIGDIVVVLTNLAKLEGYNIENCIDAAYNEISNRKGKMINGTFVKNK
jgi:NTP pyrophosphatase (non-canonical NTP hydrolase)